MLDFSGLRTLSYGLLIGVALMPAAALAQPADTKAKSSTAAPEGKPAVIERAPLSLRDAVTFQTPLALEPVRSVDVAARRDGVIASVMAKLGDKIQAQSEVARLETQERQLELTRAQAAYKAAQAEQQAGSGSSEAAAARVDEAKADVDLAQLRLDQCNVRTPLSGIVVKVHVVDGQFVQAGQPIVTVIDPTQLRVEMPVDGKSTTAGSAIQIKVEEETVGANVFVVLPLSPRFAPLRDLFLSVGSAVVVLDNSAGKFRPGQTVYSTMIPRLPVTEVPTAALANASDGERKVQVIRDGFVRDVKVQLLGQIGDDHVFVSGRFGPTDELVLKSSETLLDGARVVAQDKVGTSGTKPAPAAGAGTRSNF
jgi:multidrug efflux pump subunit AcrA (membrane-fusion protein)